MKINITKKSLKLIQGLLLVTTVFTAQADDTEVFFTESEVNSNVLFVMDNSGSMSEEVANTTSTNASGEAIQKRFSIGGNEKNTAVEDRTNATLGNNWDSIIVDGWWRTGIRFPNIDIPQGAQITKAYIRLTNSETKETTEPATWAPNVNMALVMSVSIEDTTTPNEFDSNNRINNRVLNSLSVDFNVPVPISVGQVYETKNTNSDIKTLVQAIVTKGSWQEGSALAFILKNSAGDGLRYFYSSGDDAPELVVEFTTGDSEGGTKTRMQVMQDALRLVLADAPTNLSVGIMNYGDVTGGRKEKPNGVKFAVKPVNSLARPIVEESLKVNDVIRWDLSSIPEPSASVTVGNFLSEIADDWSPNGFTPIVDALYEAALYYKGEELYFGNGKARKKWAAHPITYTHPAPNKVEPILETHESTRCGATRNKKIYDYDWDNKLTRWLNGDTGGYKCPINPSDPTKVGSSEENCAATKFDCGESDRYRLCNDWRSGSGRWDNCTGTNEAGDPTGCEWIVTEERGCYDSGRKGPAQGAWATESWCKFKVCKTVYEKKPVPKYITPIVSECQSNNVILMSDGKPEYENINSKPKAYNKVRSMIRANYANCNNSPSGFKNGACGKELTHHLAGIKLDGTKIPNADLISDVSGQQLVNTFVIGFSSGISDEAEEYLKDLVTVEDNPDTVDKEGYFSAQNEAQLAAAFKSLLDEIAQEARSQASPGYSVNVKSGLEHEDDIYIPVFDKRNSSRWSGNLKKFKLVDDDGHRSIRGRPEDRLIANSNADDDYIDAMTEQGLFKDTAWDEWSKSAAPDGDVVEAGGTASLLTDPGARKLYSNLTGNTNIHLAVGQNNTINTSSAITTSMLGLDPSTLANQYSQQEISDYKDKLINYIRGWTDGIADPNFDPDRDSNVGSARLHMGDMLHSEPVVITYQTADEQGSGKRQYIFAATNEGYLHAFDSSTGLEKFAFMPKELLKNVTNQFTGEGEHKYGIDGQISYWHNDENHNGSVDGSEHVWLYFGLRRGGHSYYALDVTNIDRPILKWVISNDISGFSDLGQTWSMPYIANVLVDGTKTPAVIFTGGNDIDQDYGKGDSYTEASVTGNITADEGKNIYIVNASTGHLLWKMSNNINNYSELTHAIPGGARILDVNRNGLLDRMYFADTGGDVWRLDLGEDLTTGTSILEKFATLGGSSANSRKFYNEPDVAMLRANGQLIYTVSIGSGLRPHPVNDIIDDHMFVLLDRSPLAALPSDYNPIVIGDLAKVEIGKTENGKTTLTHDAGFGGETGDKAITDLEDSSGHKKRGWYVAFGESGEKVLATSMTFEGSLMFTTLVPEPADINNSSNICTVAGTHGRIYIIDILTGEASSDLDHEDSDLNDNDVFEVIASGEIPGTPQTVANQLECTGEHCTHLFDIRIGKKNTEASVSNVADVESIYWTDPITE